MTNYLGMNAHFAGACIEQGEYLKSKESLLLVDQQVLARPGSVANAGNGVHLVAERKSKVIARRGSHVTALQDSYVIARAGAHVVALPGSKVVAQVDAHVTAHAGAEVVAFERSKVTALPGATVEAKEGSLVVYVLTDGGTAATDARDFAP